MTREEAKEALSVLKIYDNQWLREAVDMAIEALQDDWIPVSEREPLQAGEYLVTVEYDGGVTFTDKFGYTPTTDGGWYDPEEPSQTHFDWNKCVIAWRLLPEPYKESEE